MAIPSPSMAQNDSITRLMPAAAMVSVLCGVICCFLIPQTTYFQNVNEFAFDHLALFKAMFFPFVIITLVVFLVQLFAAWILPKEGNITPVQIILLATMSLLLVEGLVISYRLPVMNGDEGIYTSLKRNIVSIHSWEIGIILAVWRWRWFAKRFYPICAIICFMFASMLCGAIIDRKEKLPITDTRDNVLDNLAFHTKDNVIAIIADSLPTWAVEEVLENNGELKKIFENFTLFKNNLGPGRITMWAIPAILQGDVFSGDILSFNNAPFVSPRSFFQIFSNAGYNVYLSSETLISYNKILNRDISQAEKDAVSSAMISPSLYALMSFRFIPYFLKNIFFEFYINSMLPQNNSENMNVEFIPEPVFEKISSGIGRISLSPTAHIHHYGGAHHPFLRTQDGHRASTELHYSKEGLIKTTEYILNNLAMLIDRMKQAGIYDSSTIVLLGDHGDHLRFKNFSRETTSFYTPVFMLKSSSVKHPFSYSDAPMSSLYFSDVVFRLHTGIPLETVVRDLPKERKYLSWDNDSILFTDEIKLDELTFREEPFELSRHVGGMLLPGRNYPINATNIMEFYPTHIKNAHFRHGWALTFEKNKPNEFGWKVETDKDVVSATLRFSVNSVPHTSPLLSLSITNMITDETVFQDDFSLNSLKLFSNGEGGEITITIPNISLNSEKEFKLSASFSETNVAWVHLMNLLINE